MICDPCQDYVEFPRCGKLIRIAFLTIRSHQRKTRHALGQRGILGGVMKPSKEAIEAARDKIDDAVYEYDTEFPNEYIKKGLESAYSIDFAPLDRRIAELEKKIKHMEQTMICTRFINRKEE